MNSKSLWESYTKYTEDFSKNSRQLAFAGIAVCWFFKETNISSPLYIVLAMGLLVIFFICDVLQLFISAHLLRFWIREEEKRNWKESKRLEGEYKKPWWLDKPAFWFFNVKAFTLIIAFILIGCEFVFRF